VDIIAYNQFLRGSASGKLSNMSINLDYSPIINDLVVLDSLTPYPIENQLDLSSFDEDLKKERRSISFQ